MNNEWQGTFQEIGTPLRDVTFVVLDLETSGGAPHLGAAITEIGAVKVRSGEVISTFTTLVNPGHALPAFITELTGITDFMLYEAPSIELVLPSLDEFLSGETVLVAQNAPFDLSFLKAAYKAHGYSFPAIPILDTAILARKILTKDEVPNCRLGTLAEFFNVSVAPTHRALDDAQATVDVLHGLFERLAGFGVFTLEEVLNFGRQSAGSKKPTYPKAPRPRPNQ